MSPSGAETVLYNFRGTTDGATQFTGFGSNGYTGYGVIFKVQP